MGSDSNLPTSLHPSMVLGAYGEALWAGKRIVVLGDGSTPLAEQLGRASGRRVQVYDPDARRAAACVARSGEPGAAPVSYAALDGGVEQRREICDVVVVPDLSAFASPPRVVRLARALLVSHGLLLAACPNPGTDEPAEPSERERGERPRPGSRSPLGYYDLYDCVSADFPWVRMLGQAPFVGFTVADFAAEGEPAVSIDTSLVEATEEPTWFVAIGARRPVQLEPYTLVQVPATEGLDWLGAEGAGAARQDAAAALDEERRRSAALGTELERIRDRQQRDAALAEERRAAATTAATRAAELERQLAAAAEREQRLGKQVTAAEQHAAELRQALGEIEEREGDLEAALTASVEREAELEEALRAARAEHAPVTRGEGEPEASDEARAGATSPEARGYEFQIAELRRSLSTARNERDQARAEASEAGRLRTQLEEASRASSDAEQRLGRLTAGLGQDEAAAAHAQEIGELEGSLRERGERVVRLEAELGEARRVGRDLVAELEAARAGEPSARGSASAAAQAPEQGQMPTDASAAGASEPGEADAALGELRQQLEALTQKCSGYQADLEAARWTIAALRHDLTLAARAAEDGPAERKLEEALRAAQLEVARLRSRLGEGR